MKTKYFLPVAAILLAACSEASTAPLDLTVAAARQTTPPPTSGGETFDNGIASLAWSPLQLTTSPGNTKNAPNNFLGRFSNEVVSLTVPAGASSVTLTFDLYIVGSWDGAGIQGFGSDEWKLEVSKAGGAAETLLWTSFSNQSTKPQNYPRQVSTGGTSPFTTGALKVNSLGYPKGAGKYDVGDAVYRLSFTVSNPTSGDLVFYFHSATLLQGGSDESWGLDNVLVTRN